MQLLGSFVKKKLTQPPGIIGASIAGDSSQAEEDEGWSQARGH